MSAERVHEHIRIIGRLYIRPVTRSLLYYCLPNPIAFGHKLGKYGLIHVHLSIYSVTRYLDRLPISPAFSLKFIATMPCQISIYKKPSQPSRITAGKSSRHEWMHDSGHRLRPRKMWLKQQMMYWICCYHCDWSRRLSGVLATALKVRRWSNLQPKIVYSVISSCRWNHNVVSEYFIKRCTYSGCRRYRPFIQFVLA